MALLRLSCGFNEIRGFDLFFRESTLEKGKALNDAHHVDQVSELRDSTQQVSKYSGRCLSQVKISQRYSVWIQTNPSGEIEAAALVFYVNTYEDESPTSEKCRWNIPKRVQDYSKGCIVKDLFVRRQNGTGLQPAPPEEILKHFPDIECPLANLLKVRSSLQENIAEALQLPDCSLVDASDGIKEIVAVSQKNVYASFYEIPADLETFYEEDVVKDPQEILSISVATVKQAKVGLWHEIRGIRITSSIAHRVKTRSHRFLDLALSLLNNSFTGNTSTEYGLQMESVARRKYAEMAQLPVIQVGVIISHACPWLCSSPDGIVAKDGSYRLLEIKCPPSCAGKEIINQVTKTSNVPYIKFTDGKVALSETHCYYTQIQVSLFVLNLEECDFFVYSSHDSVLLKGKFWSERKYCQCERKMRVVPL